MLDKTIRCVDCKADFILNEGEQAFFQEKGYSEPKRCKPCRQARKALSQGHVRLDAPGPAPTLVPERTFHRRDKSRRDFDD